jgi:hypothetical protein
MASIRRRQPALKSLYLIIGSFLGMNNGCVWAAKDRQGIRLMLQQGKTGACSQIISQNIESQ